MSYLDNPDSTLTLVPRRPWENKCRSKSKYTPRPDLVEKCFDVACFVNGVARKDLLTPRYHSRHMVAARRHVCKELAGMGHSSVVIGKWLNMSHTSVLYLMGTLGKSPEKRHSGL